MIKKEWLWMPELKTETGLQGSDYYKPINTNKNGKQTNNTRFDKFKI